MQLAGMLDPGAGAIAGSARTLTQKWDQAQAALALERTWTKPQILEAYLNLASYRGELKGLDAAAHGLFGKAPAGHRRARSRHPGRAAARTQRAGGDGRAARLQRDRALRARTSRARKCGR